MHCPPCFCQTARVGKIGKGKVVHHGKTMTGNLLILLSRAWVRVEAKFFPHYFPKKKSNGFMTIMGT
jgi:hypothetical protein